MSLGMGKKSELKIMLESEKTYREIASELHISPVTVCSYASKLGLQRRNKLVHKKSESTKESESVVTDISDTKNIIDGQLMANVKPNGIRSPVVITITPTGQTIVIKIAY